MGWIKKHLGNILITLGVIVMLLPLLFALQWRYEQYRLMKNYQNPVIEGLDSIPGPVEPSYTMQPQEPDWKDNIVNLPGVYIPEDTPEDWLETPALGETDFREEQEPFDRENYASGMMVIEIPELGLSAAVIEGTTERYLKQGPGLYEISYLPDKEGANVCIAAHRTTYGAWFRHVDKLEEGDDIIIYFNEKVYSYKVEEVFVVKRNDWSVTLLTGYSALTLTSCHPLRSARQRIVVRARLDNVEDEL